MRRDWRSAAGLTVALAASSVMVLGGGRTTHGAAPAAGRLDAAAAWPHAVRADLSELRVTPLDFLDAHTAVGTVTQGAYVELAVESGTGPLTVLAQRPVRGDPQFAAVTVAGDRLVWAATEDGQPWQIWSVPIGGGAPKMLVADAGDILLSSSQGDLVFADGRVHWATSAEGDADTEIRSVGPAGGAVDRQVVPGAWSLSAWPWLKDAEPGQVRLRELTANQVKSVKADDCTPQWCRIDVLNNGGDLARVDVVHPDGAGRRTIAGAGTRAAVGDVAVLDRFEVLSEPGPYSDLTGTAALVVYDLAQGRAVLVSPDAGDVGTHDGMLWWSTGLDGRLWHTLDLRTA